MVLCSSWNVTKATEYYSLFERVARDRLIAPILRFATDTTCLTLGSPPVSHLQSITRTLFQVSGESPYNSNAVAERKGVWKGISAGLFTSAGVRTDM